MKLTNSQKVMGWRKATKWKIIECLGGRCSRCGYDRCPEALDFHHLDPATKAGNLSAMLVRPAKWQRIAVEAAKCVLLCCICHRELHAGLWKLEDINVAEFVDKPPALPETKPCEACAKATSPTRRFCSHTCASYHRRKIEWPNIRDLIRSIKTDGVEATGRSLGVSGASVRKHVRTRKSRVEKW
jgi:hypothetical protein